MNHPEEFFKAAQNQDAAQSGADHIAGVIETIQWYMQNEPAENIVAEPAAFVAWLQANAADLAERIDAARGLADHH